MEKNINLWKKFMLDVIENKNIYNVEKYCHPYFKTVINGTLFNYEEYCKLLSKQEKYYDKIKITFNIIETDNSKLFVNYNVLLKNKKGNTLNVRVNAIIFF